MVAGDVVELDPVVVEVVEHGQARLVALAVVRLPLASPGQCVVLISYQDIKMHQRLRSFKQSATHPPVLDQSTSLNLLPDGQVMLPTKWLMIMMKIAV